MKKKLKKILNILSNIMIYGLLIILIINYMEIMFKNVRPNPTYSSWNIIVKVCSD